MADFNRHLKKSKILVFFTIFAFLYMSCFTSCSKSGKKESTEVAQKSARIEKTEKSEAPKAETTGKQETTESNKPAQSEKSDQGCGCPLETDVSAENSGQKKPLTQEEANQKADKLDRYFQALEELDKEISRDTYDPQAIIDKVGRDPIALFQWVRDNTYLVPYRGVLRGPLGVLMDRLGNNLDRALLLWELLKRAGYQVRMAHGTLSDDQAKNLLENSRHDVRSSELAPIEPMSQDIDKAVEKYAKKYQLESGELRNIIHRNIKAQGEMENMLAKRVEEQYAFITKRLEEPKGNRNFEETSAKIDALKDHWWIQIAKDNEWIDLDPSSKDSNNDRNSAKAKDIYNQLDDISEQLFHRLNIRILIEQRTKNNLEEKVILSQSLRPSELIEKQIVLRHIPLNWPKEFNIFNQKDVAQSFKTALLNEKEWLPYLTVGPDTIIQSSFTTSGDVNKNPRKKASSSGPRGITGGLFNALAGGEGSAEQGESSLTAEWIEYEIISPGEQPWKVRRSVFDLIGNIQRIEKNFSQNELDEQKQLERGTALVGDAKILPLVCKLSPAFFSHLKINAMLSNREILVGAWRNINTTTQDLNKNATKLIPVPGLEYNWALVRMGEFNSSIDSYLDRINIVSFLRGVKLDSRQNLRSIYGIDIIANDVAVISESNTDPRILRIKQGVIDTNVEALLINKNGAVIDNLVEIYEKSKGQGIEWYPIRGTSDARWQEIELGREDRLRVEQDLALGYMVIIPNKRIQGFEKTFLGWWRIDPNRGTSLGMCASGRGQGLLEYVLEFVSVVSNIFCWIHAKTAGQYVLCGMGLFTSGLGSWVGRFKVVALDELVKKTVEAMIRSHQLESVIYHILGGILDAISEWSSL